jgi:hypothetical protein
LSSRPLTKLFAALAALIALAACSSPHHRASLGAAVPATTTTTLVTTDTWVAPIVVGPPSAHNFCTLLIAAYQHVGTLASARDLKVRQEIVADFVSITPRIIAEAPATIAPSATTYFQTVGGVLSTLNAHGLNVANLKPGQSNSGLLSAKMQSATEALNTYTAQSCHYTIGG